MNIAQLWHDEPQGVIFVSVLFLIAVVIILFKILEKIQASQVRTALQNEGWELIDIHRQFTIFGGNITKETREKILQHGVLIDNSSPIILAKKVKHRSVVFFQLVTTSSTDGGIDIEHGLYSAVVRVTVPQDLQNRIPAMISGLEKVGMKVKKINEGPTFFVKKNFYRISSAKKFEENFIGSIQSHLE